MKKLISVFLIAAMLVCFAGCRSMAADPDDNTTDGTISDVRDGGIMDDGTLARDDTLEKETGLNDSATDGNMRSDMRSNTDLNNGYDTPADSGNMDSGRNGNDSGTSVNG